MCECCQWSMLLLIVSFNECIHIWKLFEILSCFHKVLLTYVFLYFLFKFGSLIQINYFGWLIKKLLISCIFILTNYLTLIIIYFLPLNIRLLFLIYSILFVGNDLLHTLKIFIQLISILDEFNLILHKNLQCKQSIIKIRKQPI